MDSAWHLERFAEFVKGVQLSGGTTPHVAMTVASMEELPAVTDKLWFAGCYALVYNWPTAERIYLENDPVTFDPFDFEMWFRTNRAGIALRKERKAVLLAERFTDSAASYLDYIPTVEDKPWFAKAQLGIPVYHEAFDDFTQHCKYMGRYIAIRWLEVMRRAFDLPGLEMPDMMSRDGQHPRRALAYLYPEDTEPLLGGNSPENLAVSDRAAARCLVDLASVGVAASYYDIQSLLCEYKQSFAGGKQYPGKSIDTEMDYHLKIYAHHWGTERASESRFSAIRERCFPEFCLGEKNGWTGVRPELGLVLQKYGYTWSDAVYDWSATKDLSQPVLRANGPGMLL